MAFLFRVVSLGPSQLLPAPPHPGIFVRAASAFDAWQTLAQLYQVEPTSVQLSLVAGGDAPAGAELVESTESVEQTGRRITRSKVAGVAAPRSRRR